MNYSLTNEVWKSKNGIDWKKLKHSFWEPTHAAGTCVFNDSLWLIGGYLHNEIWVLE